MNQQTKFAGYRMAIAASVVMFMHLGALATIGVFIRPIAEGNGFSIAATMLIITFATAGGALLGFLAPPMIKKLTPKGSLIVASIFCGVHYWGFAFSHTIGWYWFWATMAAVPLVFGTNAVISSIVGAWFIEKRATVLGFVFGASSLGSSVWQLISGFLITNYGFRVAYMVMGTGLAILALVANLFFLRMPDQMGQKPLGWEEAEKQNTAAASAPQSTGISADGLSVKDARKTLSFWCIFLGLIMSPMAVAGGRSNVATFLTGEGMSVLQASSYSSLMALIGSGATVLGGFISQKMGNRIYMVYMHAAYILGTVVLLINTSLGVAMLMTSILLFALAVPIGTSMSPTVNSQAFGNKDYTNILTSMAPAILLGSAAYPVVTSAVLQAGGNLQGVYVIFAVCNLVGLVLLMFGLAASPYVKMKRESTAKQ